MRVLAHDGACTLMAAMRATEAVRTPMSPIARFIAAATLLATIACGDRGPDVLALTGATVYDGTGSAPVADAVVLVRDSVITCVGTRDDCPVPRRAIVRDLRGQFITPGLVDAHVHIGQTGWLDGRPDGIDLRARYPYDSLIAALRDDPGRWYASWTCAGITAAYDVGGMAWTVAQAHRDRSRRDAPHFVAAGPLVTHGARAILSIPGDSTFIALPDADAGVAAVRRLTAMGAHAVKVWFLRPSDAQWREIHARFTAVAQEAAAQGLPLIVHATGLREARAAVDAGAQMLVHSVDAERVDDAFVAEVVRRGVVYVPTLIVGRNWTNAIHAGAAGRVPEISDPLGCVDSATRVLLAEANTLQGLFPDPLMLLATSAARLERVERGEALMAENLRLLHAAGATIAVGTDAGNPLTLHGASIHDELAAMAAAGIPAESLLVMATRNGARAMRRDDLGTLQPGKSADLLVLGEDPGRSARAFVALDAVLLKGLWLKGG